MRTRREAQRKMRILAGALAVVLVLAMGILIEPFGMVAHAQSQGQVTASAKIRKEPSTTSEVAGSADKDASVTINFQTKASDGTTWYQIFIDSDNLGYIRSDLVRITDGTTPPTQTVTGTGTAPSDTLTETPNPVVSNETPVDVTAVNPVSASVTGGQSVRVRSNASTSSQIVTTVQSGLALTVTGQANGTDGNVWYQVDFIDNGTEVTGFIRKDYVNLSEEPVPADGDGTPPQDDIPEEQPPAEEPAVAKIYDTQEQDGKWFLVVSADNPEGFDAGQYEIKQIFDSVNNNAKIAEDSLKTVKTQKIVIVVLVIVVVLLAGAAVLFFMKLRENADSAYFAEVERNTLKRKNSGGKASMPTVGAGSGGGKRPSGARPGTGRAGAASGAGRPAGTAPQAGRPAGTASGTGRPAGTAPRPSGREDSNKQQTANPGWKSKNFMNDDDEFEFEFLNWDGDEES